MGTVHETQKQVSTQWLFPMLKSIQCFDFQLLLRSQRLNILIPRNGLENICEPVYLGIFSFRLSPLGLLSEVSTVHCTNFDSSFLKPVLLTQCYIQNMVSYGELQGGQSLYSGHQNSVNVTQKYAQLFPGTLTRSQLTHTEHVTCLKLPTP